MRVPNHQSSEESLEAHHGSANTTPRLRLELVGRVQEGEAASEVAQTLGLSRTTVHEWLRPFRDERR